METWAGFSSEDIKNVQFNVDPNVNDDENFEGGVSQSRTKTLKMNQSGRKPIYNFVSGRTLDQNKPTYPVPQEAKLSQQNEEESNTTTDDSSNSSLETSSSMSLQSVASQNSSEEASPKQSAGGQVKAVTILVGEDQSYKVISGASEELPPDKANNGDPFNGSHQKAFLLQGDSISRGQGKNLEKFRERQKLMEEQNKRKKELLTKAIADRKRQTQFEAKKLVQIQEDLSRLDALLSTDVAILRNQIELSSYEFNEAQKRYDRAESEFIEAKLHLFNKLERKELLTEHLCKIIEVNEQRKARKLSELMAKLEISDEAFNLHNDFEDCLFPQAAGLHEITYTACTTLKHPTGSNSAFTEEIVLPGSGSSLASMESHYLSNTTSNEDADNVGICTFPTQSVYKGTDALQSLNLITAQNLDHRNESAPCNLNV